MADLALEILIGKINEQYPQAMSMLSQPGVFQVFADAINNGWSADRITAALQATDWWKNTSDAQRQFQALQAIDPASTWEKEQLYSEQYHDIEDSLGIHFSQVGGLASPDFSLFARAVTQGWDANRMRYEILAAAKQYGVASSGGEMGYNASQIRQMANDYGVPFSDQSTMDFATKVSQGGMDMNAVQGYMIEQAKSLFPSLSSALDQGITVKQYADPYIQLAQKELNINPSDVNLTDGKWMKILNQVDPKTGQRVSMSLDQALSTFRTDPTWGYDQTDKAKQDATQLATQLQQKFGAAA